LTVIQSTTHHGIELEPTINGVKSSAACRSEPTENLLNQALTGSHSSAETGHRGHNRGLNGIQTDRDAIQAGGSQSLSHIQGQQDTIGGQGHIPQPRQGIITGDSSPRQSLKQWQQAIAEQRFTSRQPQGVNP